MNTTYRIQLHAYSGSSFGERQIISEGISEAGMLQELDDCASMLAGECEVEDEPARPFDGIIAGRQWTEPEDEDHDERQYSLFAVAESD